MDRFTCLDTNIPFSNFSLHDFSHAVSMFRMFRDMGQIWSAGNHILVILRSKPSNFQAPLFFWPEEWFSGDRFQYPHWATGCSLVESPGWFNPLVGKISPFLSLRPSFPGLKFPHFHWFHENGSEHRVPSLRDRHHFSHLRGWLP